MQEPLMAIQCYRKAIEYLDETKGGITDPTHDGKMEVCVKNSIFFQVIIQLFFINITL